jgi:hypothetical protein
MLKLMETSFLPIAILQKGQQEKPSNSVCEELKMRKRT